MTFSGESTKFSDIGKQDKQDTENKAGDVRIDRSEDIVKEDPTCESACGKYPGFGGPTDRSVLA